MSVDIHVFQTRNRKYCARVVVQNERHYTPDVNNLEDVWPWVTAIITLKDKT